MTDHEAEVTETRYIGQSVRRKEDARLLRGEGLFVSDVRLPEMAHMAVLRSPHAHARLLAVHTGAALEQPGVLAAVSSRDLGEDAPRLPNLVPHPALRPALPYALARDRVRYVGEPVALVVAESPYQAEDALQRIEVVYGELPVVVDAEKALDSSSAVLHDDLGSNLAAEVIQTVGDVAGAFEGANLVVHFPFRFGRLSGQPLETRGAIARWTRARDGQHLDMWSSTQMPHNARRVLAGLLGVPMNTVRVIAPDVGGGFGVKIYLYPEEFLVALMARRLSRPVRWIGDRREDLLATYQAREQIHDLELAARRDGTILAVRNRYTVDLGAYSTWGLVVAFNATTTLPGPYRVPAYEAQMRVAYTNKAPMAPYRAAGRPPAVFAIERALDLIARELRLDPAEVRLRNFVQPEAFPYRVGVNDRDGTEITYDSGNYPAGLRRALDLIGVERFRERQAAARKEGRYLGLGIGCYVEPGGRGPFEGATVRVQPSGDVLVLTGAASQGQSHETTLAQVCADRLGVNIEDVTVVGGDSEAIPLGVGTFASRVAVVAGSAVSQAAASVRQKALRTAALLLEASPEDLTLDGGIIQIRGVPERRITLAQVAATLSSPPPSMAFPSDLEPGLEATHYFHPTSNTYSSGAHMATVEVDVETGFVQVLGYTVVHDCGTVINPVVVDGQVHGGVAQGLGNALYEEIVYDDDGQPGTTSYLQYLMPTAVEVPTLGIGHERTPSPLNPEGIKGAGEGGAMPAPAAIANAIDDALAPLGVIVDRIPITPARLLALIHRAAYTPAASPVEAQE